MLKSTITFCTIVLITIFAVTSARAVDASGGVSNSIVNNLHENSNSLNLIAGWKSYNDIGRGREMNDPTGRRLRSRNEMYVGGKSEAGWGAQLQYVQTQHWKGDSRINSFAPEDPSLSIFHPIYKSGSLTLNGYFREYFPVSNFSRSVSQWQQAYYFVLNARLPHRWEIRNFLIPRYFSQPKYADADTIFYTEDYTYLTYNAKSWLRYGIGQHFQVEFHAKTPTGLVTDVFPFADFMLTEKIFMGPRIFVPIAVSGIVFDSARSVSLQEAQAEFYLQATL